MLSPFLRRIGFLVELRLSVINREGLELTKKSILRTWENACTLLISSFRVSLTRRCRAKVRLSWNSGDTITTSNIWPHPPELSTTSCMSDSKRLSIPIPCCKRNNSSGKNNQVTYHMLRLQAILNHLTEGFNSNSWFSGHDPTQQ